MTAYSGIGRAALPRTVQLSRLELENNTNTLIEDIALMRVSPFSTHTDGYSRCDSVDIAQSNLGLLMDESGLNFFN